MQQALKDQLLAELSRRNTDIITQYIEDNPSQLSLLVDFIISHEENTAWRAAWVLEQLTMRKNVDVIPYVSRIVSILNDIPISGTRRIIAKILMLLPIGEDDEGYVLDFCLNMLEEPKEPVAVKANCMTIVFNLIPKYPELKDEVFAIIENQIPYCTVGFKSRFNVLKRKYKME